MSGRENGTGCRHKQRTAWLLPRTSMALDLARAFEQNGIVKR
jgi:hypothetical protein